MKIDGPLVTTEWLSENLYRDELRVFDTTVELRHKDGGGYLPKSGIDEWKKSHIPGSQFLDVVEELSDLEQPVPFMMPQFEEFAKRMMKRGVSDSNIVILYNKGTPMWSTRVWWMLRSIGKENVAVLDGGLDKWVREGLPLEETIKAHSTGKLTVTAHPDMWADRVKVQGLLSDPDTVTLNALSPDVYAGDKNQYGRPGHLPGTHNVFYGHLLNPDSGVFRPAHELREQFRESGALDAKRVITYCGGGISATMDCLALHICGQDSVAVYDGSMSEWVRNPDLPLTLGKDP